ncbi:Hypothetical protein ABZS17I87_02674 [Kosakonia cowanii]
MLRFRHFRRAAGKDDSHQSGSQTKAQLMHEALLFAEDDDEKMGRLLKHSAHVSSYHLKQHEI